MKKEIVNWYDKKHFHPDKVIAVGRKRYGLSHPRIEAAMAHCYKKIKSGKQIADIDIARYVFNVAKNINAKEYEKRLEIHENTEAKIREMKINMITSWIYGGFINTLIWLFYLNWG